MMSVITYSLKKDGDKHLTKDFRVREFRCKDGSDKILLSPETVNILQSIRDYFGRAVYINSAYRNSSYNKKVGGAANSQHVKGTACDIRIDGVPPKAIAAYIEAFFPKTGCGLYSTFVHIDTRGYKVRWKNTGNNVVSSFGLGNLYLNYKKPTQGKIEAQEEEEMTQEQFNKMMDIYLADRGDLAGADWSKEDRTWAEKNKIVQGDPDGNKRWKSFVTREELAAMLHRMNK